ncbi:MAG TPA: acylphosphatase [Isosphaeraceae bacterium]|jgi:acylphosphatase|nr:acylphosphatase [Isosphaeraceae bacterium]
MVRRRAFYHGRVQGVGFRYTARRLAGGFEVAGFVRNLRDGRVELLAEGPGPEVAAFLDAIRSEFGDKIRGVELLDEAPGEPPVLGFEIRH